jgi:hypothetical protein
MTQFQLIALGVFVGIAAVAYREQLLALVHRLLNP